MEPRYFSDTVGVQYKDRNELCRKSMAEREYHRAGRRTEQ